MADASKRDRHKRAILLSVPSKDWEEVAMALTHEAKNLYNTITFLIRQVVSAYDYVSETKTSVLKDDLHQNQRDVIAAFNAMVGQINAKRIAKAKSENQDKVRLLTELTPTMSVSPLNVVLNVTLLDNVVRGWTDGDGHRVYRRLPAASAQQVVRSVIDAWKATLSAISDWAKHPEKYTGRPGFPRFLHKNGHFPLEIPFAMMTKGFPKPRTFLRLDRLGDRSEALQEAFYAHDLRTAVTHACRKRGWDVFHPQHLRIVEKAGRIKIEAVVDLIAEYPEGSFLKRAYALHGEALCAFKKDSERAKFLLDLAREEGSLRMAGIDFGETNVATVAFSTGRRALVHSGQRPNELVAHYNVLIDARKTELATSRMKELQRLKAEVLEKGEKLPKHLSIELRQEQAAVFADPLLRSLLSRLDGKRSDLEHKITTDIVARCVRDGIHVVVVGQNKLMKQGKDWGSKANRKSHAIAHARLLSLLRYKLEKHGVAVFTTEESYTSKSSFVDGDVLKVYAKKEKAEQDTETADTDARPEGEASSPAEAAYSGRRSTSNRNWYTRHNAGGNGLPSRVHADVNGAFNIIRKIFKSFRYGPGLSLKFDVRRISPRLGAVAPLSCLTG